MSSISSITKAISGLTAAQKGLQVTGHNITNTNTTGYTRQQLLQSDASYITIGHSGTNTTQLGLGVNCDEVRQIRNHLADARLRTENSLLSYYQTLNNTVSDIESLFDEPYGSTVSNHLDSFWSQAQKLSTAPDGVEERMSFISTAKVLMSKLNSVSDSLTNYQTKLNNDVGATVGRINEILEGIKICNQKISVKEGIGENANDYRDERNVLLDELSKYGEISYEEDKEHCVTVKFEGHLVVDKQVVIKMELKKNDESNSCFHTPIWSDTKEPVMDLAHISSSAKGNDKGSLKALLIARGEKSVSHSTTWDEIALNPNKSVDVQGNAYIIPKVQQLLNQFTRELVSVVNSSFIGNGIGSHEGKAGVPVFVPLEMTELQKQELIDKRQSVIDVHTVIADLEYKLNKEGITEAEKGLLEANLKLAKEEEKASQKAYEKAMQDIMVAGNVIVNPQLLADGGYNLLGTVSQGAHHIQNLGDNSIVKNFLNKFSETKTWNEGDKVSASSPYSKSSNLFDFFSEFVTDIGGQGSFYREKAHEKVISTTNIENERQAMGGVSTDEEFSNMLKYQYAYNASSRMITVLDSLLDTVVNKM